MDAIIFYFLALRFYLVKFRIRFKNYLTYQNIVYTITVLQIEYYGNITRAQPNIMYNISGARNGSIVNYGNIKCTRTSPDEE